MSSHYIWQTLPGPATDVAVGPDGGAWIIAPNGVIMQWTGAAWSEVPGAAKTICVAPGDVPWVVWTDDSLRYRQGTTWNTVVTPVPARDVAVDLGGVVWMIGTDSLIYHRVGDTFRRLDTGSGLRIAIGADRQPWIVGTDTRIWHYTGQQWETYAPLLGCFDVDVGANGMVWAIDGGSRLHRLDGATWAPTRHLAVRLGVGPDGCPWAVRPDGSVIRQRPTGVSLAARDAVATAVWQQLPGYGCDIAVGREGTAWVVGTDSKVWQFSGEGWLDIDCVARRVALGPDNTCWLIGSEHAMWVRGDDRWTKMFEVPGGAQDLAVAPSGNVWVAAWDQSIYRWAGSAPIKVPGAATRLTVDNNDEPWVVGSDRAVYRYAGGAWPRIAPPGGGALDIAAGADGSIWVTASDFRAYRLDETGLGWIATPQTANNISVGPDGTAWVTQQDTRLFRQTPSRRASQSRDFVASLYWRYLGRAPDPAGLEHHHHRLRNRSITREALTAEFDWCPEARQHRCFVLSDFVYYVSWRYLGRDPGGPGLDYFYQRLLGGVVAMDAVETEFRTSVEAQQRGPTTVQNFVSSQYWRYYGRGPSPAELQQDTAGGKSFEQLEAEIHGRREAREHARTLLRDFVVGLFWRHLGREADAGGLEHHLGRLIDGSIGVPQLDAEFATCPEAQVYQSTHAPLTILAAAYTGHKDGQEDVTARIRSWVSEQQILAWWRPVDLGAQGDGWGHVLVIVYRYGDGPARTMILPTGWAIELSPREDDRHHAGSSAPRPAADQLTILGAAYGRSDVTAAARAKVNADNRLYADVTDAEWGHAGPTISTKPLVVVYQLGSGPPIIHLTRSTKRAFINAPPLQILGATYGTADITQAIAAQVRSGTLEVQADQRLAGVDPWPDVHKTVAVVFRYGDETHEAGVVVKPDQEMVVITPDMAPPPTRSTAQKFGLKVLGAVWGLSDCTFIARRETRQDCMRLAATNDNWQDGWPDHAKTLTLVYQIDGGRPLVKSVRGNEMMVIAAPMILGAAWGPLDVTDTVAALVRGGTLAIPANNTTFGESLAGWAKSLVVVYRYGDDQPRVGVVTDGGTLFLSDRPRGVTYTKPTVGIHILGAVYGVGDVTSAIRIDDRNFVTSLFWRYLRRAPDPAGFEHHLARLVSGSILHHELDSEFAGCPEAKQVGPATTTDFVVGLSWRYLGRAPDAPRLAIHADRVSTNQISMYDLEEEFRTCPEATAYGAIERTYTANNPSWGDNWPGANKTLVIVYQVDDEAPRTLIALEGETLVVRAKPLKTGAHVAARIRLLQDYQIPPEATYDVDATRDVPSGGDTSPTRITPTPQPRGVHQVALFPRRTDGSAAPTGEFLTLVCGEPIDIITDHPGRTTLYRLQAHVPLRFAVPESGKIRLSLPVKEGQLECPLLRARWSEMAADTWAVIAPDTDLQRRMADLEVSDLLFPQAGKTSPIGRNEAGRAHALKTAVGPAMRAALNTRVRISKDGTLRLAEMVALEAPPKPTDEPRVPTHIRVAGNVALGRVMISGAARFYPLRHPKMRYSDVQASIFDDLGDWLKDAVDSLSSSFSSGFDAVASAFTTAFNATVGGLEGAFRATVEGMQSLVSVAEKLAVDVTSITADTFKNAQCVLVDATNGLVAYAVSVSNGVVSVARAAIRELSDLALLVADSVKRVALEIKQIVEFLLMLIDWGDILQTQRYLADTINAELDQLPAALAGATGFVKSNIDSTIGLLDRLGGEPVAALGRPGGLSLGFLGEAFDFIYDRVESFLGALGGGGLDTTALTAATRKLTDALLAANIELPDLTTLADIRAPRDLLAVLKTVATSLLLTLRDAAATLLEAAGALVSAVKGLLNARIYIPIVTDLIEKFILGRDLTLLNLLTLLSGAAYTVIYKLAGRGTSSPYKHASPPVANAAIMLRSPPPQPALDVIPPPVPGTTLRMMSTTEQPSWDVFPPPSSRGDGHLAERREAAFGLGLTSAVASVVANGLRLGEGNTYAMATRSSLIVVASLASLSASAVYTEAFGRWWPSELTYHFANLGSACAQAITRTEDTSLAPIRMATGIIEVSTGLITGAGMLADRTGEWDHVVLRMEGEVFTGLSDIFSYDNLKQALMAFGAAGARITLGSLQAKARWD